MSESVDKTIGETLWRLNNLPSRLGKSNLEFRQFQADGAYNLLIQRYPLVCNFYFPKQLDSFRTGSDSQIIYGEEPDLVTKALIPSIYGHKAAGSSIVLDSLIPEEKWLYLSHKEILPLYTFVECILPHTGRILNFKIDDNEERVGVLVLTQAYRIVPETVRRTKQVQSLIPEAYSAEAQNIWGENPNNLSAAPDTGETTEGLIGTEDSIQDLVLSVGDGFKRNRRVLRPLSGTEDDLSD